MNANRLYLTGGSSAGEHFQPDGEFPNHEEARTQETCVTTTWIPALLAAPATHRRREIRRGHRESPVRPDARRSETASSGVRPYSARRPRNRFARIRRAHAAWTAVTRPDRARLGWPRPFSAHVTEADSRIHTFSPARWDVTLAGVPVDLILASRFPSDGLGSIQVDPEREVEFELGIRIPRWTREPRVTIADRSFAAQPGTYLEDPPRMASRRCRPVFLSICSHGAYGHRIQ